MTATVTISSEPGGSCKAFPLEMTMTEKTLDALEPGDFVADMHDGLTPIKQRFAVLAHVTWRHSEGPPSFKFPNKHLCVLGWDGRYVIGDVAMDGSVVCGYTYDGYVSGLVILGERVIGPDPRDG